MATEGRSPWQRARGLPALTATLSQDFNHNLRVFFQGIKISVLITVFDYAFRYVVPSLIFFIFRIPVVLIGVMVVLKYLDIVSFAEFPPLLTEFCTWMADDTPNSPPLITVGSFLELLPFVLPSVGILLDVFGIAKFLWPFLFALCLTWIIRMVYDSHLYFFTGFGEPVLVFWTWLEERDFDSVVLDLIRYALTYLMNASFKASTSYPACKFVFLFWPRTFATCTNLSPVVIFILGAIAVFAAWVIRNHLRIQYLLFVYSYRNSMAKTDYSTYTAQKNGTEYTYSYLQDGYIRVLDILPSDPASNDEIRTRLRHVRLEDASFDAISYFEGQLKNNRGILVDGAWMSITKDAFEAIADRVSPWQNINTIWIESICIDQKNVRDKSQQVGMMNRIYERANRTILWLGSTPEAIFAFGLVQDIATRIPMQTTLDDNSEFGLRLGEVLQNFFHPLSDGMDFRFKILARLLEHPYFSSVGSIQEISSSEAIHIRCGKCWLDWSVFDRAVRLLSDVRFCQAVGTDALQVHTQKSSVVKQIRFLSRCRLREQEYLVGKSSRPALSEMLGDAIVTEAIDERDLVFKSVNISTEAHNPDLTPDYSIDSVELFERLKRHLLETESVQDLFYTAGIGYPRKIQALPSWIPDWSCRAHITPLRKKGVSTYDTSKGYPLCVVKIESDVISVQGKRVDRIASITADSFPTGDLSLKGDKVAQFALLLSRVLIEADARRMIQSLPSIYAPAGQPRDEAFTRTLIGDQSRPRCKVETSFPVPGLQQPLDYTAPAREKYERPAAIDSWAPFTLAWGIIVDGYGSSAFCGIWRSMSPEARETMIKKLLVKADLIEELRQYEFTDVAAVCVNGRKFAVTEKGLMALVPPGSEVGDEVVLLCGLEVPFVFRGCGNEDVSLWKMVGECYVHGIMDGEACVGKEDMLDFLIV